MVEPKHSLAGCRRLVFGWAKSLEEDAVVGLDDQRIGQSSLADDLGKNSHVVLPATVKVQHGFLTETGGPNGERIALVVLLVGVLEDVIDVGRPLVIPVDGHLTSREEDSVDLAQDIVELGLRVMIVKRKHLRAGHFQVLHIAGTDVGLVLLERLSEVLGVLGVDSDDWVLRRKGEDSG